ncbi:MAG: 3-hydroxyacyl-CoA dehydrogenase NAD-binding domain-containing protein [Paracoccaceae bacterium]
MSVRLRNEAGIGYVELDNPPVNAIGQSVRQGLLDAVHWGEKLQLARVILSGKGSTFAAGADAREFDHTPQAPHLPDVLNAIDESFVPWIAAIDGVALGGGAEIAMACRMRIMSPTSQIGLPEVTLGVIPGAGGTQRLPRLVGLEKALGMISLGKPVTAQAALDAGLIHAIEDDPQAEAFMVNTEQLGCIVPTWELPAPQNDSVAIDAARAKIAMNSPNQIAPQRALDVVAAGLDLPFHAALHQERRAFLDLKTSAQARALRHLFFAERAARKPATCNAAAASLHHVAVVGGGTMGASIAYALMNADLRVTILETDPDSVARAKANVDQIIAASLKHTMIKDPQALRDRLTVTHDYAQVRDATLAIEAAFESMDVKKEVFTKLETVLPTDAVLATNTSYLDVNQIAASINDPARVLGLHFHAPAHIMRLLEIVRGDATHDAAVATGYALAKRLGKVPVLAGVCGRFIGNRILARYHEAADTVFMDGSTPWDVDEAMVEFGYAMGPYESQDLSGLDIAHANRRRQDATRDQNRRYIPIADRMVELGKLGKKTGAGWYRYPGGGGKVEDPIVADLAIEESHFEKRVRTDYTAEDIRERLLLAMINEAADILEEGIAASASDIDLVTVLGCGFPRWRGGLMHYADTLGAKTIVTRLRELAAEDPVVWRVSPLLERCAANFGEKNISESSCS